MIPQSVSDGLSRRDFIRCEMRAEANRSGASLFFSPPPSYFALFLMRPFFGGGYGGCPISATAFQKRGKIIRKQEITGIASQKPGDLIQFLKRKRLNAVQFSAQCYFVDGKMLCQAGALSRYDQRAQLNRKLRFRCGLWDRNRSLIAEKPSKNPL